MRTGTAVDEDENAGRDVDALRDILMSYTLLDPETGYVQGMTDLLAPLLDAIQSSAHSQTLPTTTNNTHALVFGCYSATMTTMSLKANFQRGQQGILDQLLVVELVLRLIDPPLHTHLDQIGAASLLCIFRWILVSFRREFAHQGEIELLWEVSWAATHVLECRPGAFLLVAAAALLNSMRDDLLGCTGFDEVVGVVNGFSAVDHEARPRIAETVGVIEFIRRAQVVWALVESVNPRAIKANQNARNQRRKEGGDGDIVDCMGIVEQVSGVKRGRKPLLKKGKLSASEWAFLNTFLYAQGAP